MRWPRFSLSALVIAVCRNFHFAFQYIAESAACARVIARQQAELSRQRSELGVFEVKDRSKAHVIFVRQLDDKA
jgi:hypothetical protein